MLPLKLLPLATLFIVSTVAFDDGCVHTIGIYSQKGTNHPMFLKKLWKNSWKNAILQKNRITDDDAIDVIMRRSLNAIHYTNITLGTPPQNFTVYVDISRGTFWVPSTDCESEPCVLHRRYNASDSATYQKDGTPSDVDENLGYLSKDIACIAGVCAENQSFTEVTDMWILYKWAPHDGLLGIGQYIEKSTQFRPFFHSLMEQKKMRPFFSLWINGTMDYIHEDIISGELTLGGMNADRFTGSITWIPAVERKAWSFMMEKINVNGTTVGCHNKCVAEFCDNWSMISGPAKEIQALHDKMGLFQSYDTGLVTFYYIANCTEEIVSTLPDISFVIGDKEFKISSKDYMEIVPNDKGVCESRLQGEKRKNVVWTLGIPFMSRYYTMVNVEKKEIGLASSLYLREICPIQSTLRFSNHP